MIQSLLMITTLYWVLLHVSGYMTVMTADAICGWVSAPVFPWHSYLDSPKVGLHNTWSWHEFYQQPWPTSFHWGWNQPCHWDSIKCTTWALPHVSPTPCCNSLHNQLSFCFLLFNIAIFYWQQKPTLNHSLLGWGPDTSPITCSWELENL